MKFLTIDTGRSGHPAVLLDEKTVLDFVRAAPIVPVAALVPPSVRTIFEAGADGLELIRRVLDAVEVLSGSARDGLRERPNARGASAIIPPKANRTVPHDCKKHACKWRHLTKNFFAKLEDLG